MIIIGSNIHKCFNIQKYIVFIIRAQRHFIVDLHVFLVGRNLDFGEQPATFVLNNMRNSTAEQSARFLRPITIDYVGKTDPDQTLSVWLNEIVETSYISTIEYIEEIHFKLTVWLLYWHLLHYIDLWFIKRIVNDSLHSREHWTNPDFTSYYPLRWPKANEPVNLLNWVTSNMIFVEYNLNTQCH